MIKVAFFDVGDTLIHGGQPMPGVIDALQIISKLKPGGDEPLLMGIVSNYLMPSPPVTEETILALELQYRTTVLEPNGLAELFKPFDSKVTISSRAGVSKPARAIFETALARLGSTATLAECLFVTEEDNHLEEAKEYGMLPVKFGTALAGVQSFSNWNDAPLLLATLVAPDNADNLARAAGATLNSEHGLHEFTPTDISGRILHGRAKQLLQLNDPRLGALDGVYVERPTDVTVELAPNGSVGSVQASKASPEEIADAVNTVHTLIQGERIARPGHAKGTTHAVVTDANGRQRLVRTRYSFI